MVVTAEDSFYILGFDGEVYNAKVVHYVSDVEDTIILHSSLTSVFVASSCALLSSSVAILNTVTTFSTTELSASLEKGPILPEV